MVKSVAPALILGATAVALVAPVFEQLFNLQSLRLAAGLAVLVISGQIAGLDLAEKLSVPAVMITGFLLSLQGTGPVQLSLDYILPAVQTALVSLVILYLASLIDPERMNLDHVRRGGAVVLALISASLMGLNVPSELGLAILAFSMAAGVHSR
jgi:hypothetical protein